MYTPNVAPPSLRLVAQLSLPLNSRKKFAKSSPFSDFLQPEKTGASVPPVRSSATAHCRGAAPIATPLVLLYVKLYGFLEPP